MIDARVCASREKSISRAQFLPNLSYLISFITLLVFAAHGHVYVLGWQQCCALIVSVQIMKVKWSVCRFEELFHNDLFPVFNEFLVCFINSQRHKIIPLCLCPDIVPSKLPSSPDIYKYSFVCMNPALTFINVM